MRYVYTHHRNLSGPFLRHLSALHQTTVDSAPMPVLHYQHGLVTHSSVKFPMEVPDNVHGYPVR